MGVTEPVRLVEVTLKSPDSLVEVNIMYGDPRNSLFRPRDQLIFDLVYRSQL